MIRLESMSEKNIQYEEIGDELYILKLVLENTLGTLSRSCYKDQRGDYIIPTEKKDIDNIEDELTILNKFINNFLNKLTQMP